MYTAMAKQATTIATQVALAALDLAVEMCTRPWIVEPSKKFCITVDAILSNQDLIPTCDVRRAFPRGKFSQCSAEWYFFLRYKNVKLVLVNSGPAQRKQSDCHSN